MLTFRFYVKTGTQILRRRKLQVQRVHFGHQGDHRASEQGHPQPCCRCVFGAPGKAQLRVEKLANIQSPILEVVISPPALYLLLASEISRKDIAIAAQNVYDKGNGAYTGEISAEQLKDAGVNWVLIGHSERRALLGESDQVRNIQ